MALPVPAGQEPNVATPLSEYMAMKPAWDMIGDIMAGAAAIRAQTIKYLPKYEGEGDNEYKRRLQVAPWRPEFTDALQSLASKPFGKEVMLKEGASQGVKDFAEDVDARGNNLTAFARETFDKAIANGLHAILVDYPTMEPNVTLAQERASGARPYWLQIEAKDLIVLFTKMVEGREVVTHARIRECVVEKDGWGEKKLERVRVLEPGRWELWEKQKTPTGGDEWVPIGEGEIKRGESIKVPLVIFRTGERKGELLVKPPLEDLAQMQIELYRALSRQEEILTYAGSPMLSASGLAPPAEGSAKIEVGPKRILFAPPSDFGQSKWDFIQPNAANITEVRNQVASIIEDMRRLGMQPMVQKSGSITATATSVEAAKAHSVLEAWAHGLKDALEQAMVYTTEWMGEPATVEIVVSTDFSFAPFAQPPLDALDKARGRGDLSIRTYWDGLRRFDVLPPDFDPDAEEKALADEQAELMPEENIDPTTGQPIPPAPTNRQKSPLRQAA